jgi:hypothetical protein
MGYDTETFSADDLTWTQVFAPPEGATYLELQNEGYAMLEYRPDQGVATKRRLIPPGSQLLVLSTPLNHKRRWSQNQLVGVVKFQTGGTQNVTKVFY